MSNLGSFPNSATAFSATAQVQMPNAPSRNDPNFEASARQQANEFEATFLAALLKPVFEGLAKDSVFGGGFAEETWSGLLTEEYAKGVAGSANLGIADHVYDQLVRLQETEETQPPPENGAFTLEPQTRNQE